jgi:hypothetical protein
MDVGAPLIANGEPPEPTEPGERAFDDPAVAAQRLARVDPLTRDPAADVARTTGRPTAGNIVGLVRVQLGRPMAAMALCGANGRDGVEQRLEGDRVVPVRGPKDYGQRDPRAVANNMALRARFAFIRRVGAGFCAPLLAGIVAESSAARLQSMRSAAPRRSSRTRWSRCHTPAACQSRRRRQHVTPLPQPSSRGSMLHGMPLRSTNKIPLKAARSDTRGRPPRGFAGSRGSSGRTTAHNSSDTCTCIPHLRQQNPLGDYPRGFCNAL